MAYFEKTNFKQKSIELMEYVNKHIAVRSGDFHIGEASLLVVDMQKYFFNSKSHAYIPGAEVIIPGIASLIACFKKAGRPIIFTRHVNNIQNAGMMNKWWRDVIRDDSDLSLIVDDFDVANAPVIEKSQYDAFYRTQLNDLLEQYNTKQVIITGVMTNLCCETTARSAFIHGYEVFFPVDGTATYKEEFHKATLLNLAYGFSYIVSIDDLMG